MTVARLKERMDRRFDAVNKRFDAVNKRFDAVDKRFEAVDKRFETVGARFDALDAQFRRLFRSVESLGQQVRANSQGLDVGVKHCIGVLSEHEKRIKDLEPPPLQSALVLGRDREG